MTPSDFRLIFQDHIVGRKIFEQLKKQYTKPLVVDGGIDAVLKSYRNAGSREVIDYIDSMINREE